MNSTDSSLLLGDEANIDVVSRSLGRKGVMASLGGIMDPLYSKIIVSANFFMQEIFKVLYKNTLVAKIRFNSNSS